MPGKISAVALSFLRDPQNIQVAALWTGACVVGLVAVGYAQLFKMIEGSLFELLADLPWLIFFISPLCLTISWYLIRRYSSEAGGSGIPQVLAANEVEYAHHKGFVDRLLSPKVAVVKVLSSLMAVAGGAAIGREGPTLQISACIFHFFGERVRKIFPNYDSHTWIIAGSAAGLASAFNTPLGGIVYAIEEMGGSHFKRIKTPLFTAVIIAGLVSQWLLGSYLYLGFPKLVPISLSFMPFSILIGILSGAMGALFGGFLIQAVKIRAKVPQFKWQFLIAMGCGFVIAGFIYLQPLSGGAGADVMDKLLFEGHQASAGLVISRFIATFVSYLAGGAGGIFAPSLSIGASFGSYVEYFVGSGHPNLMVLLGMIGFLTGVTRTPFTSFILVLEMTDRHSAIFPMMLTALLANAVAHIIQKEGFYEVVRDRFLKNLAPSTEPQKA